MAFELLFRLRVMPAGYRVDRKSARKFFQLFQRTDLWQHDMTLRSVGFLYNLVEFDFGTFRESKSRKAVELSESSASEAPHT